MMAWWQRLFERRSQPQWTLSELQSWADMGLGSGPTSAGITVTADRAAAVPAVYSCLQIISQDVAKTSLKLRRRLTPDTFEDATDHPLFEILGTLPNPETSAYDLKREMMVDLLTYEHAYAEIVRADGRIVALWRLDPCRMRVERDAMRRKQYLYTLGDGSTQTWTFDASQPPILDLHHPSPVRQCRDLIGTAIALQTFTARFFANGGRPTGILKVAGSLKPEQVQRMRKAWGEIYGSASKAQQVAILEGDLNYQTIASANDDAQLNETQRTISTQIAAAFRVPVWRVGDMSNANYSNMEASERAYVSDALDPYFTCWEEAIRRDLLTVRQYNQFSITFDRSALIRSDTKSLHEALAVGRQAGWYSANDIRRKLGENPIAADAGGDVYLINQALAPIGKDQTDVVIS